MLTNFIEIKAEVLVVARDGRAHFKKVLNGILDIKKSLQEIKADYLSVFADEDDNIIFGLTQDDNIEADLATCDRFGDTFKFGVSSVLKLRFIACKKDGSHFDNGVASKIEAAGREIIMIHATSLDALYLRLNRGDGDGWETIWLPNSAAETCEMTREEAEKRRADAQSDREDLISMLSQLFDS